MRNISYIFPNDTQRSAYTIGNFDYYPIRDFLHQGDVFGETFEEGMNEAFPPEPTLESGSSFKTEGILANGENVSLTNSAAVNFDQSQYVSLALGRSVFTYLGAHNESFITPVNLFGNIKISGTVSSPIDLTVKIFINGVVFDLGTKTFTGTSERFFRESTSLTDQQRFTFLKSIHSPNAFSTIGFEITTNRDTVAGDSIYINDFGFIKTAGVDYSPLNTIVNGLTNNFTLDYLEAPLSTYGYGYHFFGDYADIYYNNGLTTNSAEVEGTDGAMFALLIPSTFTVDLFKKITLRLSLKNELQANENRDTIIEAHIGDRFWGFSDSISSATYANYDILLTALDSETFNTNKDGTGGFLPFNDYDVGGIAGRVIYLSGFNEGVYINSAELILESPVQDDFNMFLSGVDVSDLNFDMFIEGSSTTLDSFDMFVEGTLLKTANLNFHITGVDWTQLDLSTDLHISGSDNPMIADQLPFSLSSDLDPAGLLNMFLKVTQSLTENINLYIGGKNSDIDSHFDMFIENNAVDASRPIDLFTMGAGLSSSIINMHIERDSESLLEMFDMFVKSSVPERVNVDMMINGAYVYDIAEIVDVFGQTFEEGLDEAFPSGPKLHLHLNADTATKTDSFNMYMSGF